MSVHDIRVLCAFFVIVIFVVLLGMREKKRRQKALLENIRGRYGHFSDKKADVVYLQRLQAMFGAEQKDGTFYVDDITWQDLNMDALYTSMDVCVSDAGKQRLYMRLRTPYFTEQEKEIIHNRAGFFDENSSFRESFLMFLSGTASRSKLSFFEYLDFVKEKVKENDRKGSKNALLCMILFFFALALIFLSTGAGICCMLVVLSYNIITYYHYRAKYLPYLSGLRYVFSLVHAGNLCRRQLLSDSGEAYGGLEELHEPLDKMKGFQSKFGFLFSGYDKEGSMAGVFWTYLNMVFHLDIIGFECMCRQVEANEAELRKIYNVIGDAECAIAIGSYRKALGDWCIPVMEGDFFAENLYHPLLKHPVKNSLKMERSILLTGCNASGKSTFLRTVAVNMLLAQTIATAAADRFASGYCRIYSSMSLKDNLMEGESYYMAEIKAMKRILDAAEESGPRVVCFVDEVLRGTNTAERIAASAGILCYLRELGALCMAATHDGELADILKDFYDNYHFDEDMQGDDVAFDYKIRKGAATSRNAILLLEKMGYSDKIVKTAEEMAERIGYHVKS